MVLENWWESMNLNPWTLFCLNFLYNSVSLRVEFFVCGFHKIYPGRNCQTWVKQECTAKGGKEERFDARLVRRVGTVPYVVVPTSFQECTC